MVTQPDTEGKPSSPEGCWLRYQLDLRNITYAAVAKKARRTAAFVSMVISGKRGSKIVEAVLADMLGYESFTQLLADARLKALKEAV